MADPEQLERLRQGVEGWNKWRGEHSDEGIDLRVAVLTGASLAGSNLTDANLEGAELRAANLKETHLWQANLRGANLGGANLIGANLSRANLTGANLAQANLVEANLRKTNLTEANLKKANLRSTNLTRANLVGASLTGANLAKANLVEANLWEANLRRANLTEANLAQANLVEANLRKANLTEANLRKANLMGANLNLANLTRANLTGASLKHAVLVETRLENADLTGCHVYGISAWDVRLDGAKQAGLVITPGNTAEITVDDLEVAQFIYLLLNNERIRRIIDAVTSKVVLILGRFTPERKVVLDALRDTLRKKNYSPVVFDFEKPASRNLTETIRTLAHLARFVIADITDAKSIPQELMAIVPDLPSVPVQPLLQASQQEYGMFESFRSYPWVLTETIYNSPDQLVIDIEALVIAPPEDRLEEQRSRA